VSEEQLREDEIEEVGDGEVVEEGVSAETTPDDQPEPEELPEPTIEEQLAAAQAEAAKNLEGWQRTLAEFANARKRLERQRIEAYNNATVEVATKLLPVVDDFDLLIANVPEEISADDWFDGVELVHRKLLSTFDHIKLETIDALGKQFDPNEHEAIMSEPTDEFESGTVIRVFQTGYKIGERLIRPAIVVVAA
jgi:molecular chaperone GrpE